MRQARSLTGGLGVGLVLFNLLIVVALHGERTTTGHPVDLTFQRSAVVAGLVLLVVCAVLNDRLRRARRS